MLTKCIGDQYIKWNTMYIGHYTCQVQHPWLTREHSSWGRALTWSCIRVLFLQPTHIWPRRQVVTVTTALENTGEVIIWIVSLQTTLTTVFHLTHHYVRQVNEDMVLFCFVLQLLCSSPVSGHLDYTETHCSLFSFLGQRHGKAYR